MEKINSERFFELVKWFNNFATQLYSLFTKISQAFNKELKFNEKKRYANFSTIMPWIGEIFHMGFTNNNKYSLDVMFILNNDKLSNKAYSQIPSIIIAKIEGGKGFFSDSYWDLFSEDNLTIEKNKENFVAGKIKKMDIEVSFSGFQVDLELFNTKSVDNVIRKEILPRVKKLLKQ